MKKTLNIIITLFALIISLFTINANSDYYNKLFSNKPNELTYIIIPDQFKDNVQFSDEIKKLIIDNNYQIEYITGTNKKLVKYINGDLLNLNYYDKFMNQEYQTKSFSSLENKITGKIGFFKQEEANKFIDYFITKYGIKKEEIQPEVYYVENKININLLIILFIILILIYLYFVKIYQNIKEIGINLINGNNKINAFYNINKKEIIYYILLFIIYNIILIYFNININIIKYYYILWIIIPFIYLIIFNYKIKYNQINNYLKNKYSANNIIVLSYIFLLILIFSNILSIGYIPEITKQYQTLQTQKEQINTLDNVYKLELDPLNNQKGADPIYDLDGFNQELYNVYQNNKNISFISNQEIDERIIEVGNIPKELEGNYLTVDTRFILENNYNFNYNPNKQTIIIDKKLEEFTQNIIDMYIVDDLDYEVKYQDLSNEQFNLYDPYDLSKTKIKVNAIKIIPEDKFSWRDLTESGFKYFGKITNEEENNLNNLFIKNNLDDNKAKFISLKDNFLQQENMIKQVMISIFITTILSFVGLFIILFIIINLMIISQIKDIMVKKFFGKSNFEIYKKEIIILNILILIPNIINVVINKNILNNLLIYIIIFIIINVINLLIIKRIENKKLLEMLKQE